MRVLAIYIDLSEIRAVAGHDVVGHVDYEIYKDILFVSFLPIFEDLFLLLIEFFWFVADEEAGDVIVVVGAVEHFELGQVFFHLEDFLFCGWSLVLVDLGGFIDLLAFLEVGLWVVLLEDFEEGVLADASDCFVGVFGVFGEDADVGWVLLVGASAFAALHGLSKNYNKI